MSMFIGVLTLKRCAWEVMVSFAIVFSSSELGGLGRGIAVSDHSAVVIGFWLSAPHKLYR